MMQALRRLLLDAGFIEFMTTVFRKSHGTRLVPRLTMSDGDYLRDSPSLALRVCLTYHTKVFELGPCFRADAISNKQLREFTMLDLYWTEASFEDAVQLARRLVGAFYYGPVRRLSATQCVRDAFDIDLVHDPDSKGKLHAALQRQYADAVASFPALLNRFIQDEIEPRSKGRCLIVDEFPEGGEARAANKAGTCHVADRAEFIIDELEVVHVYTDEPDPDLAESRARAEDDFLPEDELMCALLRRGALPARSSGFGIGIERLCQVSTGIDDIREFVAAPLL